MTFFNLWASHSIYTTNSYWKLSRMITNCAIHQKANPFSQIFYFYFIVKNTHLNKIVLGYLTYYIVYWWHSKAQMLNIDKNWYIFTRDGWVWEGVFSLKIGLIDSLVSFVKKFIFDGTTFKPVLYFQLVNFIEFYSYSCFPSWKTPLKKMLDWVKGVWLSRSGLQSGATGGY